MAEQRSHRHATGRHRAAREGWFGHGRTRALLSVGVLVGAGAVFTSASWTDREVAPGVDVTAGALHIDLENDFRQRPENIAWPELVLSDLPDGGSRAAVMTVSNNSVGDAPLSYRVQASATNTLGGALKLTVRRGGTTSGATCSGGTLIGNADASLNGFNEPMDLELAPGNSHQVCIQVALPTGSNLAPSSASSVTFTFPARQEPS